MYLEDMIIAHELLSKLGGKRIDQLLDLMEDPSRPVSAETMQALRWFLKELEADLGESDPAVAQLCKALALPPKHDGTKRRGDTSGIADSASARGRGLRHLKAVDTTVHRHAIYRST